MNRAYALHPSVENSFLVRERDRRRRRELLLILFATLPFGLGLLAYSWIHQEQVAAGYEIGAQERELHELQQRELRLRLEATALSHPQRIEARAVSELGMQPPSAQQMVFLPWPASRRTPGAGKGPGSEAGL